MSGIRISVGFLSTGQIHDAVRRDDATRVSVRTRVIARLRAGKLDRMLAVGVPAPEGSALAVHAARLMSVREREAVARSLRRTLHDAYSRNALMASRTALHVPNVKAAKDRIDQVTLRLHSPRPVTPRGVARLRVLLSDGSGPMYRYGRGDLEGRLGAALAEL